MTWYSSGRFVIPWNNLGFLGTTWDSSGGLWIPRDDLGFVIHRHTFHLMPPTSRVYVYYGSNQNVRSNISSRWQKFPRPLWRYIPRLIIIRIQFFNIRVLIALLNTASSSIISQESLSIQNIPSAECSNYLSLPERLPDFLKDALQVLLKKNLQPQVNHN